MKYKKSIYTTSTGIINPDEINHKRIIYSTRSGESIVISEAHFSHLEKEEFEELPLTVLNTLFKLEFIVPSNEDEFNDILTQNILAKDELHNLSYTIQPTANCQLGCNYCGQEHSKLTANNDVTDKIIERIERRMKEKQYRSLDITWYGGEPLMAFSQIKVMSKKIIELTAKYKLGYGSMMITNGVSLKQNVFDDLALNCKIRHFQVTIDTVKEHHDKRRYTKSGEETYDLIIKNIIGIVNSETYDKTNSSFTIRMNIDQTNYERIYDFIDILHGFNFQEKRVALQFAPIVNWGGNEADKISLSKDEFAALEIEWMLYAMNKGFSFSDIIPDRSYVPCMAVDKNSEVFDAEGNIYPCYEFPYTPKYETNEYRIGNVNMSDDTHNIHAITRDWFEDLPKNISWCPKCTYFPVCGGACPKKWYAGEPACPSFKFNMEDRLVMQYLINKNAIKTIE